MRKKQSGKVALCGVLGALAAVVLLMGNIIPFTTFCAPGLAGLLVLPAAIEYDLPTGLTLYAAVSLVSLLFLPDKEMACGFVFLLGYYPLLKTGLDRIRPRLLRMAAKLLVFNGAIAAMYAVLLVLFPLPELQAEFADTGRTMLVFLLVMANVTFVIYDFAIVNLTRLYNIKLQPLLKQFL